MPQSFEAFEGRAALALHHFSNERLDEAQGGVIPCIQAERLLWDQQETVVADLRRYGPALRCARNSRQKRAVVPCRYQNRTSADGRLTIGRSQAQILPRNRHYGQIDARLALTHIRVYAGLLRVRGAHD